MKRGLQIALAVLSLIPLCFAVMGLLGGAQAANGGGVVTAELDNQFRYFSAYYLSLFFLLWWVLQDLENRGPVLRLLVLAIFLGGLARLYSYLTVGPPPINGLIGMALELGSPVLLLWHNLVVKKG
ncbi:DUF4345 domain-containing protein [Hellea sp.]|nr:DUF4345 domain-containing protein [Hellea sp.]